MDVMTQFSVMLPNGSRALADVCQSLADSKINVRALTIVDSTEHGVLRFVPGDATATRRVLRTLETQATETQVVCVPLANRPGAMADLCNRLASSRIQLRYAYCTGGARGGQTVAVIKVSDPKRALKALADRRGRGRDMTRKLRRPVGTR